MTLGEVIRQGREAIGMSQEGLAEAVGLTQTEMSKIERNERTPRFPLLCKIAKTLKISLDSMAALTETGAAITEATNASA